jgi:hypothetical protein
MAQVLVKLVPLVVSPFGPVLLNVNRVIPCLVPTLFQQNASVRLDTLLDQMLLSLLYAILVLLEQIVLRKALVKILSKQFKAGGLILNDRIWSTIGA